MFGIKTAKGWLTASPGASVLWSCSTVLSVGDRGVFQKAFAATVASNLISLLQETADRLERDSKKLREAEVAELRSRIAILEAIDQVAQAQE